MSTTTTTTPTATCIHVKPGKDGYLPPEACNVLLAYVPSFGAAVLFCILFGLTLVAHIVQAFVFRKRFCWVIIMGALWEVVAMIFRVLLTRHQNVSVYYTVSLLLMLLAPLWINAFLYMVLGRMIYFFETEKKLAGISATRLATLFVMLDITAFIVQAGGAIVGSLHGVDSHIVQIGLNVYMGGVGLQELFILCFTAIAIHLHRRMIARENTTLLSESSPNRGSMSWRWLFYTLYAALTLISIRIVFRIAEYSQGITDANPILRHEAYQYCLDALPMFAALLILNIFHPGRVLSGPDSDFPRLSRAEKKRLKQDKKERKAARKAERRSKSKAQQGKDNHPLQRLSDETARPNSFDSLSEREAGTGVVVENYGGYERYDPSYDYARGSPLR